MDKNEDRTIKNKVREKIQGVSMLPFGLIAGFAGEKEIRIIELAENGFTFRTAEKIARNYFESAFIIIRNWSMSR